MTTSHKNQFLKIKNIISVSILLLIISCTLGNKKSDTDLSTDGNKVAVYTVQVNNIQVIVCDFEKINKKVIDFPLSKLIDTCKLVKLETTKESYLKVSNTIVSDHYIGVRNYGGVPFKLFDHSGKFLRNIGKIGRGPNEYKTIYSEIIDEENDMIYLLPWPSKKIFTYNMLGHSYSPIELCHETTKAHMFLKSDTLTILNLPFNKEAAIAFQQTLTGKCLNVVYANSLALSPDFSNEIITSKNSSAFDLQLSEFFKAKNDTLYYFDYLKGELIPRFTMLFDNKKIPIHNYFELPNHFIIKTMWPDKGKRKTKGIGVHEEQYILVDKLDMTAQFINLKNDFWGGLNAKASFKDGKFINNVSALELKEEIEKIISNTNLLPEIKNKLIDLNNSLKPEDNNVIFYGLLK
jgi:hypothetical protein